MQSSSFFNINLSSRVSKKRDAIAISHRLTSQPHSTIRPITSSTNSPVVRLKGEAIVESTIYPNRAGRVQFEGTWWPARSNTSKALMSETRVCVIGRQNITLIVEPYS
jgi:membrane protein implicated in regulation of membrane protease activity